MKKSLLLLLFGCFLNCIPNPSHIIYPMIFHFQSDIADIGLKNLNIVLTGDNVGIINLDSNSFFTCPTTNDTCAGRWRYTAVPDYTVTVPMTTEYDFTARDNNISIISVLTDTTGTLLRKSYTFVCSKVIVDVLIYIGYGYDENQQKIHNFITAVKNESRKNPVHVSFPIDGTLVNNDSLFLIWLN
jgi:hypothetical protein